jgi:hypothetical protein
MIAPASSRVIIAARLGAHPRADARTATGIPVAVRDSASLTGGL